MFRRKRPQAKPLADNQAYLGVIERHNARQMAEDKPTFTPKRRSDAGKLENETAAYRETLAAIRERSNKKRQEMPKWKKWLLCYW